MIEQHIGRIVEDLGLHYVAIGVLAYIFLAGIIEAVRNFFKKLFRK